MPKLKSDNTNSFKEIHSLIQKSRINANKIINQELIDLYWKIGSYISIKCKNSDWGSSVVKNLADYLQKTESNTKGFSSQNLWRMKQFYETYCKNKKLSLLVREIGWTNNMIIISQAKTDKEKEFYPKLTAKEGYSKIELQRQFESGLFERSMLLKENVSPLMRELEAYIGARKRFFIY